MSKYTSNYTGKQIDEAIGKALSVKEEIENQLDSIKADVIEQLLTQISARPVFGTIDDNNTITVTSALADGTYTLKYEDTTGIIAEIGTITVGTGESSEDPDYEEPDEPIMMYTNQIPLSINTEGTQYVGLNGEDGYSVGYRINSSGTEAEQSGMCCTGFIPYNGETIRLKNITIAGSKTDYLVFYHDDKTYWEVRDLSDTLTDDGNGVYTGRMPGRTGYIRITCGVIDATSILTLNEEITE